MKKMPIGVAWMILGIIVLVGGGFVLSYMNERVGQPEIAVATPPPPPDYDWLNQNFSPSNPHMMASHCTKSWAGSDDPQFTGLMEGVRIVSSISSGNETTQVWVVYLDHVHIDDVTVFLASESVIRNWGQNGQAQVLDKTPYLERARELSLLAPDFVVTIVSTWSFQEKYQDYWWSFNYECGQ